MNEQYPSMMSRKDRLTILAGHALEAAIHARPHDETGTPLPSMARLAREAVDLAMAVEAALEGEMLTKEEKASWDASTPSQWPSNKPPF